MSSSTTSSQTTITNKVPIPSPSALHFRLATDGEKRLCWIRSHVLWAGPLKNIEDFLKRETINGLADVNKNGGISYWILSKRATPSEPPEEDDVIAACESLQRPVIIWTKDESYVESVHGYGIASVFTHPKYRGQGAAAMLMRALASWLDDEQKGNAPFSALFSDVGREFYAQRGGWHPYSTRQLVLKLSSQPQSATPVSDQLSEYQWLHRQDLEALCDLDEKMLKRSYRNQTPNDLPEGKTARVAFLPTFAQACWHFGTEELVGEVVRSEPPLIKGSVIPNAQIPRCWLYWVHDFKDNHLVILRAVVNSGDGDSNKNDVKKDLAALLHTATVEARKWSFTHVIVWNPPEELIDATEMRKPIDVEKYDVHSRDSSISCLRWRRGEKSKDEIVWDINEKFCWC